MHTFVFRALTWHWLWIFGSLLLAVDMATRWGFSDLLKQALQDYSIENPRYNHPALIHWYMLVSPLIFGLTSDSLESFWARTQTFWILLFVAMFATTYTEMIKSVSGQALSYYEWAVTLGYTVIFCLMFGLAIVITALISYLTKFVVTIIYERARSYQLSHPTV